MVDKRCFYASIEILSRKESQYKICQTENPTKLLSLREVVDLYLKKRCKYFAKKNTKFCDRTKQKHIF